MPEISPHSHWIGLRENPQESPIFHGKKKLWVSCRFSHQPIHSPKSPTIHWPPVRAAWCHCCSQAGCHRCSQARCHCLAFKGNGWKPKGKTREIYHFHNFSIFHIMKYDHYSYHSYSIFIIFPCFFMETSINIHPCSMFINFHPLKMFIHVWIKTQSPLFSFKNVLFLSARRPHPVQQASVALRFLGVSCPVHFDPRNRESWVNK